jgi:biopolymer transport protein TolR
MGMGPSNGQSRMIMSEINVTPLVDVMLVLLIMFMVTAPMMQQGIEVDLPKTAAAGVSTQEEPTVLVITQNKQISIAKRTIPENELKAKLTAIFEGRKDKQIYIQADRRVDYGFVAEVMADIRQAGITSIGLITVPKE